MTTWERFCDSVEPLPRAPDVSHRRGAGSPACERKLSRPVSYQISHYHRNQYKWCAMSASNVSAYVCMKSVCHWSLSLHVTVCMWACVCVWERESGGTDAQLGIVGFRLSVCLPSIKIYCRPPSLKIPEGRAEKTSEQTGGKGKKKSLITASLPIHDTHTTVWANIAIIEVRWFRGSLRLFCQTGIKELSENWDVFHAVFKQHLQLQTLETTSNFSLF